MADTNKHRSARTQLPLYLTKEERRRLDKQVRRLSVTRQAVIRRSLFWILSHLESDDVAAGRLFILVGDQK